MDQGKSGQYVVKNISNNEILASFGTETEANDWRDWHNIKHQGPQRVRTAVYFIQDEPSTIVIPPSMDGLEFGW